MSQQPDQFDELEAAMRKLPLQRPGIDLDQRIQQTLAAHPARPTHHRWIIGFVVASMAAAAAILIAFWQQPDVTPTQPLAISVAPTAQPKYVVTETAEQWQDDGIVEYTADGPVRQYRFIVEQYASAEDQAPSVRHEEIVQVVSPAILSPKQVRESSL